jgi:hypothetical protein
VAGSSTREHAKNCVLRGDYAHEGDVAAASLCFNINIKVVTKGCDDSAELDASFAPEGGKVTAPTMTLLYKHIPGTNIGHYDLVFTKPAAAVCVGTSGCRQQQHQAAAAACVFKPCVSQAPAGSDWQEAKCSPTKRNSQTFQVVKNHSGKLNLNLMGFEQAALALQPILYPFLAYMERAHSRW